MSISDRQKRLYSRNLRKLRHRFERTINEDLPQRLKVILDEYDENDDQNPPGEPVLSLSRLIDTAEMLPHHGFNNSLYIQLNRIQESRVLETSNGVQSTIIKLFDDLAEEMKCHMSDVQDLNIMGIKCVVSNESHFEETCCICFSNYIPKEEIFHLECNHLYHKDCIVPWVKDFGNCPLCRAPI